MLMIWNTCTEKCWSHELGSNSNNLTNPFLPHSISISQIIYPDICFSVSSLLQFISLFGKYIFLEWSLNCTCSISLSLSLPIYFNNNIHFIFSLLCVCVCVLDFLVQREIIILFYYNLGISGLFRSELGCFICSSQPQQFPSLPSSSAL